MRIQQELYEKYLEELHSWCLMELNWAQLCNIKLFHGLITRVTDYPELTRTTVNSWDLTSLPALVRMKAVCEVL